MFLSAPSRGFESDFGIEFLSVTKDQVTAQVEVSGRHLNGDGVVHGGVIMAFADAVASHGAVLNLPRGARTTTLESKTNFVRAGEVGVLTCEARPLHIGRSTMLWQSTVQDADKRTLAIVMQTQMVLSEGASGSQADRQDAAETAETIESHDEGACIAAGADLPKSTAERRKAQIMEAAFRVIAKKGFANSAIREIAQEAGMPVPTMYQYVRSKDDILAMIFDSYLGEVEASVQHSAAGARTAADRLKMAIAANMTEFDRFQAHIRMMNRETASLRPELRDRVKNHMRGYISIFRDIIAEGIEAGEFRRVDAHLFANFVAMLCEIWPLRNWSVGKHGLLGVQSAIVDLVLHSLARPERVEA